MRVPARNGLHIVNSLSQQLNLKILRDGYMWEQEYHAGEPATKLSKTGATDQHGTSIHFLPDSQIFSTIAYSFQLLAQELHSLQSKHPALTIKLIDERHTDQDTDASMKIEFGISGPG
jgi:DNA gyrase subunit B